MPAHCTICQRVSELRPLLNEVSERRISYRNAARRDGRTSHSAIYRHIKHHHQPETVTYSAWKEWQNAR
jgi:hypothetical protein